MPCPSLARPLNVLRVSPRAIVTCGPSHEAIDRVRRITNFSTGELGILLANRLALAGFDVLCLKGAGATCPIAVERGELREFSTNDDLRGQLEAARDRNGIAAVFHAAALADFRVKSVSGAAAAAKIPSSTAELTVTLEPASKLITSLRGLFPGALIVGWKYELDGFREGALARARLQLDSARTDLCVLNGDAWGRGFGVCAPGGGVHPCESKPALCDWLAEWARGEVEARLRGQ